MRRLLLALAFFGALPAPAAAYDHQISLDLAAGWGVAPALADGLPDHGPVATAGAAIGFDDTWGLGVYAGWAVHPRLTDAGEPLHIGMIGAEALYYIDILEVVPFFGAGIDLMPTFDGVSWGADFAAHLRASLDWLLSREIAVGLDIRPYILFTNLDLDPVYLTFQLRLSVLLDY